ncbi:MFS transporter [Arthrobacter sp. StoSoilA2]|nr:MFS transporter [Arthrobacter sp. StoSoilA2]
MDLLEKIRAGKMSKFQVGVIVTCFLVNIIEGFDIFMMAFVMPALSATWNLGPVQIGYLLSAALIGMTVGSFALSPLGDRIGRRRLILACLGVVAVGMGLSYLAADPTQLVFLRALTGLGVGGTMSSVSVLVSEYSTEKHGGLTMGLYTTGLPLGGLVAGAVIGATVGPWGWRSAFLAGALATVLVVAVASRFLSESLDFLTMKRPPNALDRVNAILLKMNHPALTELPLREQAGSPRFSEVLREIFGRRMLAITVLMWLSFGMLQAAYFSTTSWTPQALTFATGNAQLGVLAGSLVSLGGILGSVVFAVLSVWIPKRVLTIAFLGVAAVIYVGFSASLGAVAVALVLAVALGLVNNASIAGFYTLGPRVYSPVARATGFGWILGAGRIASFAAPIVVGYLIGAGWSIQTIFIAFAVPMVVSSVLLVMVTALERRRSMLPQGEVALAGNTSA